ncbi:hypothetical protein HZS61_017053 [Fusarium oxysporum f. sp. conglutinans]|uniref:Uncharacterized protein n=1 Tax=Fusarium oxysporum f. sp. conglutinans TaxID=100902 RepID=A0A8H6GIF3_FUSOX|nr:hypothetical protein HZS61_017053 [Fusarium oxysporum f. sp. conglutinans]
MNTTNNDPQAARRPGRPLAAEIDESLVPIIETVLQRHRAVTLDAMTDILQDGDSLINDDWDQVDEDEIEAKWQRSERKKSSNHVGTRKKNDDPLRDLWRVCVRFFKQTPPVLLSPYNRLQFVPKIEKDSAALSCHLFTKGACNAIADLILHTVWQQDHRPFIHTLIYAANCRSFKGKELPKTVHQLHIYARNAAIEEREEPSIFSDLMYGIGESATVEKSPSMRELDLLRHNIIPFRITDVECIQKTIDAFAYSDERVSYSVKSVADAFKLLKRDEVPTRYQLQSNQPADQAHPRETPNEWLVDLAALASLLIFLKRLFDPATDHIQTETRLLPLPRDRSDRAVDKPLLLLKLPGEQFASAGPGSIQHERDRAPPHMGAQDRFIEELKSSVESQKTEIQNLSKRLTETDRKVEGHESRIRSLQEENRVLKQQLTRYVTGTQSDSP